MGDNAADTLDGAIWFDNMLMKVLLPASAAGGAISLVEQWHFAGYSPPTHCHEREDQTLYILDGAITARLGDVERALHAGEAVFWPRGVPHTFRVEEDGTRLLEINTPGGFERFHIEAGEPATEMRLPEPSPPDVPRLAAISASYGCEILGPPMT
jgi:quercetin dioxygenase-like cupin family protein